MQWVALPCEAPFALAGTHTIHYTAPASTSASAETVVQRCGGAAHSGSGVLVNAAGCCFLNAVAMVGVVPYRKYAAGSPAPSPELSAFFSVSSLLALLPYSVQAVGFLGFCFRFTSEDLEHSNQWSTVGDRSEM